MLLHTSSLPDFGDVPLTSFSSESLPPLAPPLLIPAPPALLPPYPEEDASEDGVAAGERVRWSWSWSSMTTESPQLTRMLGGREAEEGAKSPDGKRRCEKEAIEEKRFALRKVRAKDTFAVSHARSFTMRRRSDDDQVLISLFFSMQAVKKILPLVTPPTPPSPVTTSRPARVPLPRLGHHKV